jgi:hypothetical protein
MQTFLPYESFTITSKCLDRQRLGKQRVEAWQILQALQEPTYGWQNHPAVKMWRGYEFLLCEYGQSICEEWISRGYKDSLLPKFLEQSKKYDFAEFPKWLGYYPFHASHRSNLLRKNHDYYSKFGWTEPDTLDYIWEVI